METTEGGEHLKGARKKRLYVVMDAEERRDLLQGRDIATRVRTYILCLTAWSNAHCTLLIQVIVFQILYELLHSKVYLGIDSCTPTSYAESTLGSNVIRDVATCGKSPMLGIRHILTIQVICDACYVRFGAPEVCEVLWSNFYVYQGSMFTKALRPSWLYVQESQTPRPPRLYVHQGHTVARVKAVQIRKQTQHEEAVRRVLGTPSTLCPACDSPVYSSTFPYDAWCEDLPTPCTSAFARASLCTSDECLFGTGDECRALFWGLPFALLSFRLLWSLLTVVSSPCGLPFCGLSVGVFSLCGCA